MQGNGTLASHLDGTVMQDKGPPGGIAPMAHQLASQTVPCGCLVSGDEAASHQRGLGEQPCLFPTTGERHRNGVGVRVPGDSACTGDSSGSARTLSPPANVSSPHDFISQRGFEPSRARPVATGLLLVT